MTPKQWWLNLRDGIICPHSGIVEYKGDPVPMSQVHHVVSMELVKPLIEALESIESHKCSYCAECIVCGSQHTPIAHEALAAFKKELGE